MLKSWGFNVVDSEEMHKPSWSDSGESKHLKVKRSFRYHITTLKEHVVFFLFFEFIMVNYVLKISKENVYHSFHTHI